MKSKLNIELLISIVLIFAISGCGNPTDANKGNFKKAINQYYSKPENCISQNLFYLQYGRRTTNLTHFPLEFYSNDLYSKGRDLSFFESLKDAGLLIRTKIDSKDNGQGTRYELTEEGKKYISTWEKGNAIYGRICYGQREVHDITSFTPPSNFMGHTVTFVEYSYTSSINDWEKDLTLEETSSYINSQLEEGKIHEGANETLVLMNDGWIVDD